MATDPNTMNLLDYTMMYGTEVQKRLVMSLYQNTTSIFKDAKFKIDKTLERKAARITDGSQLPDINFLDVNEAPPVVKGAMGFYTAPGFLVANLFRKPIIFDELKEQQGETGYFERQYALYQQAWVPRFNEVFFNGQKAFHAPNVARTEYTDKEMKGIKAYMEEGSMAPDMSIDAGGVDITAATGNKGAALGFFAYLRAIADNAGLDDLSGWVLYMPPELKTAMWLAGANAGGGAGFGTSQDAYEKMVDTFLGAKVRTVGRKVNQYGRVLPIDENAAGVSPTGGDGEIVTVNGKQVRKFRKNFASIWAVNWGEGNLEAWHGGPPDMKEIGPDDTHTWNQARMQWYGGIFPANTRCIARIYNIKIGDNS